MKMIRPAAIAASISLLLSACGSEDQATGLAGNAGDNSLLAHVPAGSPYLVANLAPTPDDVIDSFLTQAEPVLATMQRELVSVRQQLESDPGSADQGSRLALAVLRELDGKLNRDGLESLGFDLQAEKVLYGMGAFPVMRMGLSDAASLNATVERILANAGITAPQLQLQGKSYWRIVADADSGDELPAGLFIAILDDHVAISLLPTASEQQLLPRFLGLEQEAASDARQRLQAINSHYGYQPYGTGVLDLKLLANEFFSADSSLNGALAASGMSIPADLSAVCKQEITGMLERTPRLILGTTELTAKVMAYQYVLETQASLAQELVKLVSDVPMVSQQSARLMEFAFGMKFGPVRDFLTQKTQAITESPYQCEQLQDLNESAAEALQKLQRPMPPLVNNFRGLRLSLGQLSASGMIPDQVAGMLAVHVDQPEMFVGMAQMFLPDLSNLSLKKNEPPVALPANLLPLPDAVAHAALSDSAIGVSLGAGEETGLLPWLQHEADNKGSFLSVNYDTVAYMDLTRDFNDSMQALAESAAQENGEQANQLAAAKEIAAAMEQAYREVAGRTYLNLRFTDDGFVADSRMTFR